MHNIDTAPVLIPVTDELALRASPLARLRQSSALEQRSQPRLGILDPPPKLGHADGPVHACSALAIEQHPRRTPTRVAGRPVVSADLPALATLFLDAPVAIVEGTQAPPWRELD